MTGNSFKHSAINRISVIYGYSKRLEMEARSNIKDELAIEVRNLLQDIIYKIELFEKENALAIMPKQDGEI